MVLPLVAVSVDSAPWLRTVARSVLAAVIVRACSEAFVSPVRCAKGVKGDVTGCWPVSLKIAASALSKVDARRWISGSARASAAVATALSASIK